MTDTGETMGLREVVARIIEPGPSWRTVYGYNRADAILRLPQLAAQQARIVELEAALEPFAEVAELYDSREADSFEVWLDVGPVGVPRKAFRLGHYRIARAALRKDPQQ